MEFGGYLSAKYNNISNCLHCILFKHATWEAYIDGNIINQSIVGGITVSAPSVALKPRIRDNILTESYISLKTIPGGWTGYYGLVEGNTIQVVNPRYGIEVLNSEKQRLYDNTITINQDNELQYGISIYDSHELRVKDNTISSTANFGYNLHGIKTIASDYVHFCCNSISETTTAISFTGFCNPTHLRYTNIYDNSSGLICNEATVLGHQIDNGNLWLGTYSAFPAFHSGGDQEIFGSQFFVEDADPGTPGLDKLPPLWPSSDIDPIWFLGSSGNAASCVTDSDCRSPIFPTHNIEGEDPEDFQIKALDERAATGGYSGEYYSAMLNWQSAKYLYQRINSHPGLLGLDNTIDSFYYASGFENIATLIDVENQLDTAGDFK